MKLVRPKRTLSPEAQRLAREVPPIRARALIIVGCAVAMVLVAGILAEAGLIP